MKVIEQSAKILNISHPNPVMFCAEQAWTCYQTECRGESHAENFIRGLIASGHHSQLEHVNVTVEFITDRGVTHEIVRHRLASYSQESTRYCNYSKGKFGSELTFIRPVFWDDDSREYLTWEASMTCGEVVYLDLVKRGASAQEARTILPNSLKADIRMTANLREWRHFFNMRCAKGAHPQMRDLAIKALALFKVAIPVIFDDLIFEE